MAAPSSSVASRFVSEEALAKAEAVRAEEWRKTYERLGQEPPPMPKNENYDGRTLFERLQEQKVSRAASRNC